MQKTTFALLGLTLFSAYLPALAQSPVVTNPTGSQTITQPAGTSFNIQGDSTAPATAVFGMGGSTVIQVHTDLGNFYFAGAGNLSTTGTSNLAIGLSSLGLGTTANLNTSFGPYSLFNATTASQNTALGFGALGSLTTGGSNLGLGIYAGNGTPSGPNQTATNSIYIGQNAAPLNDGDTFEVVLGNYATGKGSHTTTLGSQGNTWQTFLYGQTGIGTASTNNSLSVINSANLDYADTNTGDYLDLSLGYDSGEGIGSGRTVDSPNRWGLDFYTSYAKRLSISQTGQVGIDLSGQPTQTLELAGNIQIDGAPNVNGIIFPDGTMLKSAGSISTGSNGGNVGIGTNNPQATLDVSGSLRVSNPSLVSGLMLNQTYVDGCTGNPHLYKIATLPASSDGTYDHLHLLVTINPNWSASANQSLDVVLGNRNGFTSQYTSRGATNGYGSPALVAYQNSDTSVDVYVSMPDAAGSSSVCTTAGYTVLENLQETVYATPVDYGSTPTGGTMVFNTNSSNYPPAISIANNGLLTVQGNIALTQGSGGSIIFPDNTVQSTAWNGTTLGGDYAEAIDVVGQRASYEPGDVIVISDEAIGKFSKSAQPYSRMVAGVFSTKPGLVGRRLTADRPNKADEVPMAMLGIAPTKVTTENGPIERGDLLVSSSTPGYAMKGTDRDRLTGAIIGKAIAPLPSGVGVIEVLISLQ